MEGGGREKRNEEVGKRGKVRMEGRREGKKKVGGGRREGGRLGLKLGSPPQINGINGTWIANQYVREDPSVANAHMRTLLTHNNGGFWELVSFPLSLHSLPSILPSSLLPPPSFASSTPTLPSSLLPPSSFASSTPTLPLISTYPK